MKTSHALGYIALGFVVILLAMVVMLWPHIIYSPPEDNRGEQVEAMLQERGWVPMTSYHGLGELHYVDMNTLREIPCAQVGVEPLAGDEVYVGNFKGTCGVVKEVPLSKVKEEMARRGIQEE